MKTITLKDIPSPVHTALKQRAHRHRRSLNKEILACLEMAVAPAPVNVQGMLLDIRAHRAASRHTHGRLIRKADQGRP